MIQTMVKEYKKVHEYQKDVEWWTKQGWKVAEVTSQQHGRSGAAKGAIVGSALLTGGLLAPAAIFALTSGKSYLVVMYTREEVELPVIPSGLDYWSEQAWLMQHMPAGMVFNEWADAVEKHTKEVRAV